MNHKLAAAVVGTKLNHMQVLSENYPGPEGEKFKAEGQALEKAWAKVESYGMTVPEPKPRRKRCPGSRRSA